MGLNMNGRLIQLMSMVKLTHWSSSYWIILGSIWSFQLFELYLHVRQKRFYTKAQLPASMPPETFERARQYSLNKIYFEMISRLYRMVMLTVLLHFKHMARFYEFLVEIPLTLYFFVVLEEKHGFNNDQFFSDLTIFGNSIKGNVLSKWFSMLEPFYSDQSPLKAGPLRSRLEALATRLGFPVDQLCVREVSYRTKHAGAGLLTLFFYKRVFIDDTLLQLGEEKGLSEKEIEAVVAHELSHWKLKHAEKLFFIVGVVICFRSYLFDYLNQTLGLDGVSIIVDVLQTAVVLGYLRKVLSRTVEFQADAYATKLGYGKPLKSALIKLGNNSLDFPKSDALFSAWHHSHPTIVERLAAIDLLMRKSD